MNWVKIRKYFGLKFLEAGFTFCLIFAVFIPLLRLGFYPKKKEKTKKNVLLYGAYGNLSIGDDAILESILENIKFENHEVVISSFRPEVTKEKTYHKIIKQGRTLDGLFHIHKVLKDTEIMVFGGGGVLETHNNSFRTTMIMVYKLSKVFYAKLRGVKIFCFAIGSNTKKYSFLVKLMVKTLLKISDQVTTRDPKSTDFLINIYNDVKIKTLADPALLLSHDTSLPHQRDELGNNKLRIGINVMPYYKLLNGDKSKLDKIRNEVVKALDYFMKVHDVKVVFIPMVDIDDTEEQEAIISKLKNQECIDKISPLITPKELMKELSFLDVFIGTRLHANILAFNIQIPIMGLAYHEKISSFFDYIGMSDFQQSIFNITAEKLICQFEYLVSNRVEIKSNLEVKQVELKELAKQTFQELVEMTKKNA